MDHMISSFTKCNYRVGGKGSRVRAMVTTEIVWPGTEYNMHTCYGNPLVPSFPDKRGFTV